MAEKRRCVGTAKSTGERCKKPPLPGATVCKTHGGAAPQVMRKAAERVVEQKARAVLDKYDPTPQPVAAHNAVAELLQVAGEMKQFKDFLAAQVSELRAAEWRFTDVKGSEQFNAVVAAYERALDRTARVLVEITRLKLEERQVKLAEREGVLLAEVIRRTADALLVAVVGLVAETAGRHGAGSLAATLEAAVRGAWPGWLSQIVPQQIAAVTSGGDQP